MILLKYLVFFFKRENPFLIILFLQLFKSNDLSVLVLKVFWKSKEYNADKKHQLSEDTITSHSSEVSMTEPTSDTLCGPQ